VRPGLAHIERRAGTQPSFLRDLTEAIAGRTELAGLTTRDLDDPTIALLDAAATMLDVLSFYSERLANEGFHRTATERRSVLELARAVGYELGPGVAASTMLSFSVDLPPGVEPQVTIAPGTQAQKLPGDDGTTAVFETVAEVVARPELNELRPAPMVPVVPTLDDATLYLDGVGHGVQPGDLVVLVGKEREGYIGSEAWDLRRLVDVHEVPAQVGLGTDGVPAYTALTDERGLGHHGPLVYPALSEPRLFHLPVRAGIFGNAAMRWRDLPLSLRVGERNPENDAFIPGPYAGSQNAWADADFDEGTDEIWLDRIYPEIVPGSWIVLVTQTYAELFRVTEAEEANRSAFLLNAQATKLTIEGEHISFFGPRTTVVLGGATELPLGGRPATDPIEGTTMTVAGAVTIEADRLLVVQGTDADTGAEVAEVVRVDAATVDGANTDLELDAELVHRYARPGLRILGNVAPATHGQTWRSMVLGSGDATVPFATYGLPSTPLTYVSAPTASGRESTLEVRVDGLLWTEVPTLYGQRPDAQVYCVRHRDDGTAAVQFGDGITGARTTTGRDNITASFRVGTGTSGLALPGQISVPLSMPLGLREVANPLPATGAEDAESIDAARENAPVTVQTLDRIVSLRDYEDFVRAFAGIGGASAASLDTGTRRIVHLSVETVVGTPIDPTSTLYQSLVDAIDQGRHPDRPVVVEGFLPRPVAVVARLRLDPRHERETVLAAATADVAGLVDLAHRRFGQHLTPTDVLAALQRVAGVSGAVLDDLRLVDEAAGTVRALHARPAAVMTTGVRPAELLAAGQIQIGEVVHQ
jgi:hypothetical protein